MIWISLESNTFSIILSICSRLVNVFSIVQAQAVNGRTAASHAWLPSLFGRSLGRTSDSFHGASHNQRPTESLAVLLRL
jgi:hypothetical protein